MGINMANSWKTKISNRLSRQPPPVRAVSMGRILSNTYSLPYIVDGEDNFPYVVKSPFDEARARSICNEQILSAIGRCVGVPVPVTPVIYVSPRLVDAQVLAPRVAGLCHGSQVSFECTDRQWLQEAGNPILRSKFASIAVFYRMVAFHDHQLFYSLDEPIRVLSADHGMFLPIDGDLMPWTDLNLRTWDCRQGVKPELTFFEIQAAAGLGDEDYAPVLQRLCKMTEDDVAEAVARPPSEWGIILGERVAAAEFLWQRRCLILEKFKKATKT